ncbi:MAG: BamA/TamA family outer membrane protein [Bacteroidales bacterium]|nr:BamA/TamA family outer membrane protein [Bacteroidales bacterium]
MTRKLLAIILIISLLPLSAQGIEKTRKVKKRKNPPTTEAVVDSALSVRKVVRLLNPTPEIELGTSVTGIHMSQPPEHLTTKTQYADSIGLLRPTPSWLRQYLSSLIRGNVDRTHEKRFDVSFGLSPSYTREASFGIGAMATGLYRMNRQDSILQPSDVFASINCSLNGFYVLTFKGNNIFPDGKSRLSYKLELYRKRLDFWGLNSEETAKNPKSKYDRRQIDLQVEYIRHMARIFYFGPQLRCDYTDARNIDNLAYMLGERHQYYVTGVGVSFEFDTRDNLVTPTRGWHLAYKPMLFWKCLGSAPASFFRHTIIFNVYKKLWRGSVLAYDLYSVIQTSHAPWTMREMVASDGIRMRGYYMGSYIDNNQVATQIELRQHVWRRLGFTAWVGGATVFSSIRNYTNRDIRPEWLHNFGLGLRFEIKHNVNARIDYGFGQHTSGILFAVGEAF